MSKSSKSGECVKVIIRCRPINDKELKDGHKSCVEMDTKKGVVEVQHPKNPENNRRFTFDSVYDWNSKQKEMYDETFKDLVQSVLEGFNGTIFAYGQTGTGKTHTMQGLKNDAEQKGVIPRSFEHIFGVINLSTDGQYLVRASYLEIYKEIVRDLLHKDQNKRLEIKENPETGVYVDDLSSVLANSCTELDNAMHIGNKNRSVGPTNMNEHSSRSHAIFIITIECSRADENGESHIRVGKLNMVDLAGSERQSKTHSEGERLKEATKINLSLSALGNVISALVDGKSTYVPYRDSKLTRLLQDSLGGNSKTVMVANIGPASYNFDETLNTLRYANRAKNIKNKPKINEDPKDTLLREYQEKIEKMKALLESGGGGGKIKKKRGQKKTRRNIDGEEVEVDSDEEDEEINAKEYYEQKKSELESEKQSILADKSMVQEKKNKLLEELKKKEDYLGQELSNKEELEKQIKTMESKLLCGDKDIEQHTREQEAKLEKQRQEINAKKKRYREIHQQMETEEAELKKMRGEKMSLDKEVELNTTRMKKLKDTIRELKLETNELHEEHRRAREELEERLEELTKQNKLKELMLSNFVAPEDLEKLKKRLEVIPENEGGDGILVRLKNLAGKGYKLQPRPVSAIGARRAQIHGRDEIDSPRYLSENVLIHVLQLDGPTRTTREYEPPKMAPHIVAALETALQDEDDEIELDANVSFKSPITAPKSAGRKRRTKKRTKDVNSTGDGLEENDEQMFPSSRGLVDKQMK